MTTVLERPAAPVPPAEATRALAAAEARLLLRSPGLWVGAALTVALSASWTWTLEPAWDVFVTNAGMSALVLAGFLVVLGHLAASRDHRHGAQESASALPVTAERRTTALLVLIPVGGLAGALTFGLALLAQAPSWPAGVFEPWNALAAVVLPMTGAAIGIGVGTWLPATSAGPLALFTAAASLAVLPVLGGSPGSLPWRLFPVEVEWSPAPGFPRPSGWHLLYLLAMLAAVTTVGLLRHRRWRPGLASVLGLAVVLAGVAVQRQGAEQTPAGAATLAATERYLGPEAQRCERRGRVEYCPLRGYGRWIPLWRAALEPVVDAVPAAGGDLPAVRQGIGPVTDVVLSLRWARHGAWAEDSRVYLVQEFVRVLLGFPAPLLDTLPPATPPGVAPSPGGGASPVAVAPTGASPGAAPPGQRRVEWPSGTLVLGAAPRCSGAGQLRTVVGLYLVAQAQRDSSWWLAGPDRITLGAMRPGPADRAAAMKLLEAPRERVAATLAQHWSRVRSAAPAGDVFAEFGVTDLPVVGDGGGPLCP